MYPKISVIVPFYNAQGTLERAVGRLREQTYRNLEIILIDDGSEDESLSIAKKHVACDARIHLICKSNGGVSGARNIGLDAAHGDWVYFADADDWVEPDCIEALVNAATSPACDLVVSDFYRVKGEKMAYKHGLPEGLVSREKYATRMAARPANFYFSSLWNKLFRRSIIEEAGLRFDTGMRYGEDHVFILEYLGFVDRVALVDRALYYYVDTPKSLLHKGLTPFGVIKMKYNVFGPYRRFFRRAGLFERLVERPKVYKFLIMPGTDGLVRKGCEPLDESMR